LALNIKSISLVLLLSYRILSIPYHLYFSGVVTPPGVAGGAGLTYEFFKILGDHKKQVRAYYESMTEQELQYLSQIEDDLIYEHEKTMSVLDEQQQLTDVIINRSRESSVQGALGRYIESRQIYQSLQNASSQSKSLKPSGQNLLPPIKE
jgi:hypothetical protein